jgi:hypothetical protein
MSTFRSDQGQFGRDYGYCPIAALVEANRRYPETARVAEPG